MNINVKIIAKKKNGNGKFWGEEKNSKIKKNIF